MRWLLILCLISACSKDPEVLPQEKMQLLMWDYIRADVYANEFIKRDTTRDLKGEHTRILKQIFKKHGVSKDQFFESYQYYATRPELFNPLLDTIIARQSLPQRNKSKNK